MRSDNTCPTAPLGTAMRQNTYTTQGWVVRAQAAELEDMICDLYGQGNSWMSSLTPERRRQARRDLDRVLHAYRSVVVGAGLLDG